ncbi:hypothetical protein BH10ACT3_BH10ACT3_18100 [soil metagenome]
MSTGSSADPIDPSAAEFFEAKYSDAPDNDPWNFASSAYELDRYRRVLSALPRGHYRRAFEPGCSVGALSRPLSRRCDHLLAMDFAPTAIDVALAAQEELARNDDAMSRIEFRVGELPQDLAPGDGAFDLIVFAEIGYYFELEQLDSVAELLVSHLVAGGDLVAAHWTGHSEDHRLSGEQTHDRLALTLSAAGCVPLADRRRYPQSAGDDPSPDDDGFIIDTWRFP